MISIKTFQKKYNHHINRGLSFTGLLRYPELAKWDFEVFLPTKGMNLQRDLVWTLEQKQSLIITILRGQKINPIVVIQNDHPSDGHKRYNWQVIDGKQRLTTIFAYLNDEFSIVVDGEQYKYSQLPIDCKKQIDGYYLTVDVHYSYQDEPISDETKIDLFEEINWLGTPQEISHMNKLKS